MAVRYFICTLLFIMHLTFSYGQSKLNCDSLPQIKVDSLFNHHINSLKSIVANKYQLYYPINDRNTECFIDFFYYLSGITIGEREYNYAKGVLHVKPDDVRIIEYWYEGHKDEIICEDINKIFSLMREMKMIKANNLKEYDLQGHKIMEELEKLKME